MQEIPSFNEKFSVLKIDNTGTNGNRITNAGEAGGFQCSRSIWVHIVSSQGRVLGGFRKGSGNWLDRNLRKKGIQVEEC